MIVNIRHFLELSSGWVLLPELYSAVSQNQKLCFFRSVFLYDRELLFGKLAYFQQHETLSFFHVSF